MRIASVLALSIIIPHAAQAETLKGNTAFVLNTVEALQETGSPSPDPEHQMACEMQFAGTGADGDLKDGTMSIDYDINTDTNMMTASGSYSYSGGSETATLDNFFTLGIAGVYTFMDTSQTGVLYDDYGVFRLGFTLSLEAEPVSAYMLVTGGDDFMCKLST